MLTGSIRGRWKLGKRIGKGGFGEIYISQDLKTRMPVAIKFEKIDHKKQALKLEIAVLRKLQVSLFVPKFIYCGRNLEYNYLIMELLGPNLSVERRRRPEQKFSLSTTIKLGIEIISAIQDMHKLGFIHRDIKPSNFVLRRTDRFTKHRETNTKTPSSICCMIDFGLSRSYRHRDGNLRPPRPKVGFRGTARYASINSHEGKELSRSDDLWSLLYLFVEFLKGELPWSPIKDKLIISKLKKKFNSPELVKGLPDQFLKILEHILSLKYEDEPNYNYLRQLLTDAYYEAGYDENTKFDWEIEELMKIKKGKRSGHNRKGSKNMQRRKRLAGKKQLHKKTNNDNDNQKTLSDGPLDSNAAVPSLTNTPLSNKNKKKKKVFSKKFLLDIQKMNEIVIPSREELQRRQKIKGFSCVQQKRESPKVVFNPKKNESDFFDLIEANPRNEIYGNGPDYALMIKKIEEEMEMEKEKKKNVPSLKQSNENSGKKDKKVKKKKKQKKNKNEKKDHKEKNIVKNPENNSNSKKNKSSKNEKKSTFDLDLDLKNLNNENNSSETDTLDKKTCRCVIQ
ncbi:tau-tubulin kinase 1 [Anaeramoeba flamelloides]|uniref:non-specific serine/threonine protein kinase n=1 Tax=Anaeramoeba flamelloides TaxID=1746091 RepID=A0ABQ8ZFJ6_9EUKA|nr:tau-tubulin kinase 1 [Anaeramoeba flamelloides]